MLFGSPELPDFPVISRFCGQMTWNEELPVVLETIVVQGPPLKGIEHLRGHNFAILIGIKV